MGGVEGLQRRSQVQRRQLCVSAAFHIYLLWHRIWSLQGNIRLKRHKAGEISRDVTSIKQLLHPSIVCERLSLSLKYETADFTFFPL